MKFVKYPSLTNHYVARKKRFINLADEYVATEKINGTNVSILVDQENNIAVANRNAILTEELAYRPWNTLAQFVADQKDLVLTWTNAVRNLAKEYGNIVQVHFYGELYGSKVQKMAYQESLDKVRRIRFFDIHVLFDNDRRLALSQESMLTILGEDYTVPVLRAGKLIDLIQDAEELQSQLGDCLAEGQVYKPKNAYFFAPDSHGNIHYPVIKHKYDDWAEKCKTKVPQEVVYTESELKLIEAIESRVTLQRVSNVLSHGDIDPIPENTGVVIKAVLQDIKEEIIREEPEIDVNNGSLFGKRGGQIAALFKRYLTEME